VSAPPPGVRRVADGLLALTIVSVPLSTTGMEVGIAALGALAAVASLRGWDVLRRSPLDGVIVAFYGVLALSTLASGRPQDAVGWSHSWVVLGYFVVFWWVRDARHARRLAVVLVVAGMVAAAYGVAQHFTGIDWYRQFLGRPTFVRLRTPESSRFAVVGFFRNYLTYAHTMIFPLAFSASFALAGIRIALAAVALETVAIAFSTARGAWLAALALVVALGVATRGRRVIALVFALIVAVGLAVAAAPELRAEAAHMFGSGGENAGRVEIYAANLDIIHDHPVFGLGFGRYQADAAPYYDRHPGADRRSHAHNDFLQIAAEAGLTGLAAFGLLWAVVLRRGAEAIRRAGDPVVRATAAGGWAGVVGFLVGGLTQYNFGDAEVVIAMWTAVALMLRAGDG
jgi:O-antigen ligase